MATEARMRLPSLRLAVIFVLQATESMRRRENARACRGYNVHNEPKPYTGELQRWASAATERES